MLNVTPWLLKSSAVDIVNDINSVSGDLYSFSADFNSYSSNVDGILNNITDELDYKISSVNVDETLSGNGVNEPIGLNGGLMGISAGEGMKIEDVDDTLVFSTIFNGVNSDETLSGNGADIPLGLNGGDIEIIAGEGIEFVDDGDSVKISSIFNSVSSDDTLSGNGADIPLGLNGGDIGLSAGEGIKFEEINDSVVISTIFNGVATDDTLSGDGADIPLGLNGGVVGLSAGEGMKIENVDDTLVFSTIFNGVLTDDTLSGDGANEPLGLNGGDIELSAGEGIDIRESDGNVVISSIFNGAITDDTLSGDGADEPLGINGGLMNISATKGVSIDVYSINGSDYLVYENELYDSYKENSGNWVNSSMATSDKPYVLSGGTLVETYPMIVHPYGTEVSISWKGDGILHFILDEPEDSENTVVIDGKYYRTVTIGNQTWLAQNLDLETDSGSIVSVRRFENVAYGRLYQWDKAVEVANSIEGWHLPTIEEWNTLADEVGGENVAGTKLKTASGWNGTDDYGFGGLPAGIYIHNTNYYGVGTYADFWSSNEDTTDTNYALYKHLVTSSTSLEELSYLKSYYRSVRLVKDT